MKTSTITKWLFLFFVMMTVAATAAADDPVWPRQITKPGGKLVIYQPQVDDWKDFQQVDGRMAFTITPTGGKTHVGVMTVQLQSAVNMDAHTVCPHQPSDHERYRSRRSIPRRQRRWTN